MTPEQLHELRQLYLEWISSNPSSPYELEKNFHLFVELVSLIETIIIKKTI